MHDFRMPTVALLAGGLASRMWPATRSVAKSMLPLAGEPFLGHQLKLLARQRFRDIVICCGHFEEQLRDYAGNGSRWGCRIRYSPDGPVPLGTGGALRQALPILGPAFMVMYGDSYLPADFRAVWENFIKADTQGLMTVFRNEGRWDCSNVEFEQGRIVRYSKTEQTPAMQHIDYGLSAYRAEAFFGWQPGERFDLADVSSALVTRGKLAGYEVKERFYEIGSPAGMVEAELMLRQRAVAPRMTA